ncbi:DUF4416 family protein [Candidatus Aerophobetes bacterium]|nr:DUF4416 family protein [Candidatus Aerophobetes bacterium]
MGKIRFPLPAKLITGIIFSEDKFFVKTKDKLTNEYGEVDFESHKIPFTYTDYYQEEMGEVLWRKFLSFKSLIAPEKIVGIKLFTNKLEEKFVFPGTSKRKVNIDPGYLTLARLVLATTKDFSHRIYLGEGIYGEVTLRYSKDKGFQSQEWTYSDYRSAEYLQILNFIRSIYQKQIGELKNQGRRL